jgi:hypothetical protein
LFCRGDESSLSIRDKHKVSTSSDSRENEVVSQRGIVFVYLPNVEHSFDVDLHSDETDNLTHLASRSLRDPSVVHPLLQIFKCLPVVRTLSL